MNLEFFDRLCADSEFCETLGKVALAAGRFESDLRAYLRLQGVVVADNVALGPLISMLEKHKMLSENGVQIMRDLKQQRNYLTHSLFDLLLYRIDETMLPREGLDPGDVATYSEKAWELEQNLSGLTHLVEDAITRLTTISVLESDVGLLFRP